MTNTTYSRRALHAGSWYEDDTQSLNTILTKYLLEAKADLQQQHTPPSSKTTSTPRGIISPHAGYSYSGPTAAYAYMALDEALNNNNNDNNNTITILVLHPSHHVYLNGCALSNASIIETPLGDLNVNTELRDQLLSTAKFTLMDQRTDEEEHSGEMQYPFIAKVYNDYKLKCNTSTTNSTNDTTIKELQILPIMIGAISTSKEQIYGEILAPFIAQNNVFSIISSDFCHWGSRFDYTPTSSSSSFFRNGDNNNKIYQFIEWLDKLGMDQISLQEPGAFAKYLKEYKNTICGRHPIGVYLNAIVTNKNKNIESLDLSFVKYDQSSQVKSMRDSSVSYASAVARKLT